MDGLGRRSLHGGRGWTLFGSSYALTLWLYSRNLQGGGIFETLSSPDHSSAELVTRWWANYESNLILAFWCITVGAIGVHFALASALLYIQLTWTKLHSSLSQRFRLDLQYVPGWLDRSHGWRPVVSLAGIVYASAINFAISMIAVFDMLHSGGINLSVAAFFGAFGVFSNLSISVMILLMVVGAHRKVRIQTAEMLLGKPSTRSRRISSSPLNRLRNIGIAGADSIAEDLRRWPAFPIANPGLGLIKVMPGFYAIFQFARLVLAP